MDSSYINGMCFAGLDHVPFQKVEVHSKRFPLWKPSGQVYHRTVYRMALKKEF
jgi:hypothetical protein